MKTLTIYRTENNVEKCIMVDTFNATDESTLATCQANITSQSTIDDIATIFAGTNLPYAKGKLGDEIQIGGGRPRSIRHAGF